MNGARPGSGWGAALLVVGLLTAAVAYQPVLDNFFVCDDYNCLQVGHYVLDHPAEILHQSQVYQLHVGADHRPLGNLGWAALVALFGNHPRPYYLLLLGLHLLNGGLLWLALRRRFGDDLTAGLAAVLFLTAYGARNVVCWIATLNESFCLTMALIALDLARRSRGRFVSPWLVLLLVGGSLLKESIAPLVLVLVLAEGPRPIDDAGLTWRQRLVYWSPLLGAFALYVLWRLLGRSATGYQLAVGSRLLSVWPALLIGSFCSDLWTRVLALLDLLPLVGWTVVVVLVWLAARGPANARIFALWALLQPLPFAILDSTRPESLPSRYLYLATAPAMTLVAMLVVGLVRRVTKPGARVILIVVLTLLLGRWVCWGLGRMRQDERQHWQVASTTLRRDFRLLDEMDFPPGTTVYLHLRESEQPAGGAWWGWGGYPVYSGRPLTLEVRTESVWTPEAAPPYAIVIYRKATGPVLAKLER